MKVNGLIIGAAIIAIAAPLVIALSLKASVFSFAKGDVESWIAFWGSYIGALVGVSSEFKMDNISGLNFPIHNR